MVNKSKTKGTAAESSLVKYLQENGFPRAERRALSGGNDKGDINCHPKLAIEVKSCAQMSLASWVREAEVERVNAKADIGVCWHKKVGTTDPGNWYVTMSGAQFTAILHLLGYTTSPGEVSA